MGNKSNRHIKGRDEDGKKIVSCGKCGKEIVLEIDEKAMEGMMGQLSTFTKAHLKCKGRD
ncbi:hypothetical protein KA005_49205 [bacterium]|nr:hypothetical protein [bacterium]